MRAVLASNRQHEQLQLEHILGHARGPDMQRTEVSCVNKTAQEPRCNANLAVDAEMRQCMPGPRTTPFETRTVNANRSTDMRSHRGQINTFELITLGRYLT